MRKFFYAFCLGLLFNSLAFGALAPFADGKFKKGLAGIAHIGGGKILAVSVSGNAKVFSPSGEVLRTFYVGDSVNRSPIAFPEGGAVIGTISGQYHKPTHYLFVNAEGNTINKQTFPGIGPAKLKLESDGTVQANPMGRALYFNSKGEVEKEVKINPNMIFYTPFYTFPNGKLFAGTGILKDDVVVPSDSIFSRDFQRILNLDFKTPTYRPSFVEGNIAVVPRWSGKVYATDSEANVLDEMGMGDFVLEPSISLDGKHVWIFSIGGAAVLRYKEGALRTVATVPVDFNGVRAMDEDKIIGNFYDQVLVVSQSEVLAGEDRPFRSFQVETRDGEFLEGEIVKIDPKEWIVHSNQGRLYRIKF